MLKGLAELQVSIVLETQELAGAPDCKVGDSRRHTDMEDATVSRHFHIEEGGFRGSALKSDLGFELARFGLGWGRSSMGYCGEEDSNSRGGKELHGFAGGLIITREAMKLL